MAHVSGVICDIEYDGDAHFHILPKVQFKFRSQSSNFETQNYLLKHAYLVQLRFRIPNMPFVLTTIRNDKIFV